MRKGDSANPARPVRPFLPFLLGLGLSFAHPNPLARLLHIVISLFHVFLMEGMGVVRVNMAVSCLGHGVNGSLALLEAAWWYF